MAPNPSGIFLMYTHTHKSSHSDTFPQSRQSLMRVLRHFHQRRQITNAITKTNIVVKAVYLIVGYKVVSQFFCVEQHIVYIAQYE